MTHCCKFTRILCALLTLSVYLFLVHSAYLRKNGMRGKGLYVIHYYGDYLWRLGSKRLPNAGYARPGLLLFPPHLCSLRHHIHRIFVALTEEGYISRRTGREIVIVPLQALEPSSAEASATGSITNHAALAAEAEGKDSAVVNLDEMQQALIESDATATPAAAPAPSSQPTASSQSLSVWWCFNITIRSSIVLNAFDRRRVVVTTKRPGSSQSASVRQKTSRPTMTRP